MNNIRATVNSSTTIKAKAVSLFKGVKYKQEVVTRDAGSDTNFTLEKTPVENSVMVFIDGIHQNTTFYTIINTKTIQFNFEVDAASNVTAFYQYTV